MKVKTADLKGINLDWAVAMIDFKYFKLESPSPEALNFFLKCQKSPFPVFDYSSNWERVGPLIEASSPVITICQAKVRTEISTLENGILSTGVGLSISYLESFLRAFVALHSGDEVDIPDELLTPQHADGEE
nr:hypothetical protein [Escherichia coli]